MQLEVLDAPIQMLLPDEMMGEILARLTPATVAKCCMVCRQWRRFGEVRDDTVVDSKDPYRWLLS